MQKLQMMRVECDIDGKPKLLFKIFPTGLEFGMRGKTFFLKVESDTLKKLVDNFRQDSKIRVI